MDQRYDLVIIGGGPAGVTAALRARELGAERVALLERGALGGVCTNDGCVPMRVLAKAARLARDARQWQEYGLTGEAPAVNIAALMGRVRHVIEEMHDKKTILSRLETAGITVRAGVGPARFLDPHTLAVEKNNETFIAEKVLLCAGGKSRQPPIPGALDAHIHSDLWNLETLPRSVIVIGAAATGCQAASVLRAFGAEQVTLVETAPRILPQEDVFVSETVAAGFARSGIRVLSGIGGVKQIDRVEPHLRQVTLDLGEGKTEVLSAELVLLCTGWTGNLESLHLDAAGIATERGFIKVDDTLRSVSAPHVFAAGDINGRLMLVQTAMDQAYVAAENAVCDIGRENQNQIVPHGGFTDPEYASVGLTEVAARENEPYCIAVTIPYSEIDRAVIDGRAQGGCKLIVSRQSHLLLGACVAGEEAMEIIHLCAAAMAGDLTIDRLAQLELAYPTYSAVVGRAARDVSRRLGLIASQGAEERGAVCAAEWEFGGATL